MLYKFGYIWRKVETRKRRKNYYSYRNLKPKGSRVFSKLDKRIKIQEETGISISLNLKKPIPDIAIIEYNRKTGATMRVGLSIALHAKDHVWKKNHTHTIYSTV